MIYISPEKFNKVLLCSEWKRQDIHVECSIYYMRSEPRVHPRITKQSNVSNPKTVTWFNMTVWKTNDNVLAKLPVIQVTLSRTISTVLIQGKIHIDMNELYRLMIESYMMSLIIINKQTNLCRWANKSNSLFVSLLGCSISLLRKKEKKKS